MLWRGGETGDGGGGRRGRGMGGGGGRGGRDGLVHFRLCTWMTCIMLIVSFPMSLGMLGMFALVELFLSFRQ